MIALFVFNKSSEIKQSGNPVKIQFIFQVFFIKIYPPQVILLFLATTNCLENTFKFLVIIASYLANKFKFIFK